MIPSDTGSITLFCFMKEGSIEFATAVWDWLDALEKHKKHAKITLAVQLFKDNRCGLQTLQIQLKYHKSATIMY